MTASDSTRTHPGRARLQRLSVACILVSCVACAASSDGNAPRDAFTVGRVPLDGFQWAVLTEGSVFLVPVDGYLYPARKSAPGILESMPPQVSATIAGRDDSMTFPLHSLVSPHEVDAARWVLQLRADTGWRDQGDYHFDDTGFVVAGLPRPLAIHDFDTIRFRPAR